MTEEVELLAKSVYTELQTERNNIEILRHTIKKTDSKLCDVERRLYILIVVITVQLVLFVISMRLL